MVSVRVHALNVEVKGPVLAQNKQSEEKQQSFVGWLVETVLLVAAAFVLAMGIRTFLVDTRVIPSGSMEPTIHIGDRVLVDRIGYRFHSIHRGDIVVFKNWQPGQPDLIKRVVGLPGETIAMDAQGRFTINGKPLQESYLTTEARRTMPGPLLPVKIPSDSLFMMGDNRNNSGDSRFNGPVLIKNVLGRAFFVYWPPRDWHVLH